MPGADRNPRTPLSRRALLRGLAAAAALPLLAACGGGAPPPATSTSTLQAAQATALPSASTSQVASSSSAARGEARGQCIYAWHTTITPTWLDPQEYPPQITPFGFGYALHDALVKHLPGKPFAPSLAESYEVAADFKSATFKLRPGVKFHDGSPVTPEDVQFTYEKYRGASAKALHDKTEGIEIVDKSTIRFHFKGPFLDFLTLYGSPASGAGWVVPRAYYEKVGPNGFKQKPIGAGPYRFVSQQAGAQVTLEAVPDYWRKTPAVKTLIFKGISEGATRVAMLQTGEADMTNLIPGELLDTVKRDPKLHLVPTRGGAIWLEMPGFEKPDSPFHDVRVRQAVSLAIDRKAISDAEMGGLGYLEKGNWIPEEWPGALDRPSLPTDVAKARQLMAEAGHPNGFEVEKLTILPPYFSMAERIVSQLAAIGIRTKVNIMERGAYYDALANGPNRLKGLIVQFSGAPGDAASRIRENATCKGAFSGTCIPEVEDKMQRYDSSADQQERKRLLDDVQSYLLDNAIFVPILRQAFINAVGPRIANKPEEVIGSIPQYSFAGPYEDVQVRQS